MFGLRLLMGMLALFISVISFAGRSAFVQIDGSSTVYPISEAVVEEYEKSLSSRVPISIGVSGTGAGIDRLCHAWIDIADASRQMTVTEKNLCFRNNVPVVELKIALDAIIILVNKRHQLSYLTIPQLKKIWSPASQARVMHWSDIHQGWSKTVLNLYAPAPGSGTLGSFTEDLFGRSDYIRSDYIANQDLNVIVMGISRDKDALGFVSYAYYKKNQSDVSAVSIEDPKTHEAIAPTVFNIVSRYYPFSRYLYLYVNTDHLAHNASLLNFVSYYLNHAPRFVESAGYVPMSPYEYLKLRKYVKLLEEKG